MGRRRNMPSRKKIFEYWREKITSAIDDNTCFKCGFTLSGITAVDRAHILSVYDGGSDDVSNLHLLCSDCHKQSEVYSGGLYDEWFNTKCHTSFVMGLYKRWNNGNKEYIHESLCERFEEIRTLYVEKHGLKKYTNLVDDLWT